MKRVVGLFNEDCSKIEFFNIVTFYKNYTILEKQTFDSTRFYIYDEKTASLGKLQTIKTPDKNTLKEMINNNYINWLDRYIVFFWADSKFVTEFGFEEYDRYLKLYKSLLEIRENDLELFYIYKKYKRKNIIDSIIMYFIYKKQKRRQRLFTKSLEKELKIIW